MKITPGIYRSVSTVALPLASLYLMWRSRRQPAYRDYWDERFAWGTYPLRTERPRVWIHAVSVGETNAAKPLLEAMLKSWPECDVVLTHMTPTGREAGKLRCDDCARADPASVISHMMRLTLLKNLSAKYGDARGHHGN